MRLEQAPKWEWDFATRGKLHPSMTFSRLSGGYYTDDADGVVKYSDVDEATFLTTGVLIAPGTTNRCLYNRDFRDATWSKSGVTVNAVAITGVDGEDAYVSVSADNTDGTLSQDIVYGSAQYWQVCFFVKRVTGTGTLSVSLDGGSTYEEVTVTDEFVRQSFNITSATASTLSLVFKLGTIGDEFIIDMCAAVTAGTIAGNAFRPSRPSPTTSSVVATSADLLTFDIAKAGFSSTEGTIIIEASYGLNDTELGLAPFTNNRVLGLDTDTSNYMCIGNEGPGYNKVGFRIVDASTTVVRLEGSRFASNTPYPSYGTRRIAISWAENSFNLIDDGLSTSEEDTVGTIPSIAFIGIGSSGSGTATFGGTIKFIKYYDKKLTEAQIKHLTRTTTEI